MHSRSQPVKSLATAGWLLAAPTQHVLRALAAAGYEARVVGGAVRNALLDLPVTDIDIATTASPDQVIRAARQARLATVPTGLAHGTVTVIADGETFEVTTLRTDVESDGRHATVAFTTDWAADASRRDFTINALYCAADGTLLDPLGGLGDLADRRIRFIGDAASRIREDYLRIMRFFRFTAQYSPLPPDPDGLAACVREREGLRRLSPERIRQELVRLLVAPRALEIVRTMQEYGTLAQVLPLAPRPRVLARLIEIESHLGHAPDPMSRLAALAVATDEDALRLAVRLRLSTDERERLQLGGRLGGRVGGRLAGRPEAPSEARAPMPPDDRTARVLLYREGDATYRQLTMLAWAYDLTRGTDDAAWTNTLRLPDRWQIPVFPLRGADVLAAGQSVGLRPGPRVGALLRALEDVWVAEDFAADRATLLRRLEALVRDHDLA